jgi:hypothetical protein
MGSTPPSVVQAVTNNIAREATTIILKSRIPNRSKHF